MAMDNIELSTISAQFSTLVGSLAQQATSKTAPSTMFKTGLVGKVPQLITYVGKVQTRTITDLQTIRDTQLQNMEADTRYLPAPIEKRATFAFYEESTLLRLIDMKSGWAMEVNKAFQRDKDIMFVQAFLGKAITSLTWTDATANAPGNLQLPTSFVALPAKNTITELIAAMRNELKRGYQSIEGSFWGERVVCYVMLCYLLFFFLFRREKKQELSKVRPNGAVRRPIEAKYSCLLSCPLLQ